MEREKILDAYIHDYLVKRKYNATSKTFQAEATVSTNINVIDAPGGFLFEWWSVFWDEFVARNKPQVPGVVSYNEQQQVEDLLLQREIQKQKQLLQQRQDTQSQHRTTSDTRARQQRISIFSPTKMYQEGLRLPIPNDPLNDANIMQQQQVEDLLSQREIQKQKLLLQQREDTQSQHRTASDTRARQQRISNFSPTKMYQEGLRLPIPNDPLNDANMMRRFGDNMGHILDSNHATTLKSLAGQSRYTPYVTSRGISGCLHPTKNEGFTDLPLRGWPLTGVDQLRPRVLQPQQPPMQSPQASHQFQLQRQFMLQAQQKLPLTSVNNSESQTVRMLNEQNEGSGDGIISAGDTVSNDRSLVQVGHPILSRGDIDMLLKQQQQLQSSHEHQQQYRQGALLNKQSQASNYHLHKQDNMVGADSIAAEGSLSSTTRGNDQASKNRTGKKRKCPISSSGSANSSGTRNTTGPSPSSAPSTPSLHTLGDLSSTPTLPHSEGFSQPSCMFGNNGAGTLASAANQSAQMDCFVSDRSLDDNGDTFLSNDDAVRGVDTNEGSTFSEIGSIHANQVDCCHLSSDGKLLATGGNDKKAYLWCTDLMEQKCMFEEHSHAITDTRFSPTMPWLATSSLDKTVRVWDVENPDYSLRTFVGHSGSVMSLDFHPKGGDLICSCDDKNEIRYWSIKKGGCARVLQGSSTQVRFQPIFGRYIAAVVGSSISIVDVETAQTCENPLKSHALNVQSVCWDFSGELLASLSEDLIRVWKIGSGARRDCIRELSFSAKKFRCCVFHPHYPSLLVIGCSQSLDLWNIAENKMTSPVKEPISALTVSDVSGLVASASEDNDVKLWKWI